MSAWIPARRRKVAMTLFRTANRLRTLRLSATHDHFKIVRPEDEELRRVLHEAAAHLESKAKGLV